MFCEITKARFNQLNIMKHVVFTCKAEWSRRTPTPSPQRSSTVSQPGVVQDVYCSGLPIRSTQLSLSCSNTPTLLLPYWLLRPTAPFLMGGSDWLYTYAIIRAQWQSRWRHLSALVMLTDTYMMQSPTGGNECPREQWSSLHPTPSSVHMIKISSLSLDEQ